MAQRGLKTVEALAAAEMMAAQYAMIPPPGMLPAELAVWDEVTANVPAGWIPHECTQVLVSYCKHAAYAQVIDAQIAQFGADLSDPDALKQYAELMRIRKMQTDAMNTAAGSMRLTPRAQRRAPGDGKSITVRQRAPAKPWAA
ncbi:MAG: hypothetical protein E6Q97_02050 [Desulfurellales bacterium]|nr:MAG: hypothetical protein E6Q97_02050 [Desulfurellales bacterium]